MLFRSKQIAEILGRSSMETFMQELVKENCKEKISLDGLEMQSWETDRKIKPDFIVKKLNESLDKKEPAGIDYYFKMINPDDDDGTHASLVVGRRFNPKTEMCEYQVRNSWGKNVSNFGRSVVHEDGLYWVNEAELSKHLFRVNVISKSGK